MRRTFLTLTAVCAVALAGCTTTGTTGTKKFSGAQADVAKAISDLQTAAQRKDATKICSQFLAKALVTKLDAPGTSCNQEIDKAISDSDELSLLVQSVTVNGNSATSRVQQGKNGSFRTATLVREANRWKLSGLSKG
jgi:hypothetical protein